MVLPGRKWVLETEHVYEILIEIYDKDSHRIYPSDVSHKSKFKFAIQILSAVYITLYRTWVWIT